ncbi:MAG: toprim domain-containing protein [Moraxella sp.]|nr:toprim domain-containing protein [Moraxella sp.]
MGGFWWWHPRNPALPAQIWITEGIFDAAALFEAGVATASSISCVNFPERSLELLRMDYEKARRTLPTLVFAYDNDPAGRKNIKKHIQLAKQMGFSAVAALPPYDKHEKKDWNALLESERLNAESLAMYRYYGDLLTANSPTEAGVIRYLKTRKTSFYFEHDSRTFWFNVDMNKLSDLLELEEADIESLLVKNEKRLGELIRQTSTTTEILNAKLEALYFQRNEVTDESWYFVKVSNSKTEKKTTITGEHLSSPNKLKPRLLSVLAGTLWTGTAAQLDTLAKAQMEGLKEVKTVDFIGYAKEHAAYVFTDVAIKDGKVIKKNEHDYYKIGRLELKSLSNEPEIFINTQDAPNFHWWYKFHKVRGEYGVIVLAWWLGSYFSEQIRGFDRSYPFFELVGQAGAGKSRLIEFLWKLSGREDYEGFDPTKSTNVAVYRNFAQVAGLPVCLIEGDRNDEAGTARTAKVFEWDSLKDAFNGRSIRSKGIKNNGNDTYSPPFRASIMISQNEEIQASEAMLTRIVHVRLTRDGQSLETKRLVDELDRLPVHEASCFIAHALKNEQKILETYREKVGEYEMLYHEKGITHTRVALNHAQIAALIDCLKEHIFGEMMADWAVENAKKTLFGMAKDRINRLKADHPEVERFWDVYEYLYYSKEVVNHMAPEKDTVAINLNHFYNSAKEYRQELPDLNVLKRLLKSSSQYKFIDSNVTIKSNLGGFSTIKCWLFKKPANHPSV